MKRNCLLVIESHVPAEYYVELTLEGIFPFYLVTDGDKTLIEKKIDDLKKSYDGNIYVYEPNQEYQNLLNRFLMHNIDVYNNVKVISKIDLLGNVLKDITIETWDKEIRSEEDQKAYLISLKTENTCRYFNKIEFEGDKVIKTAKTDDAIKLQKIENKFYDDYGNVPVLAKKLGYDKDKNELILKRVNGKTAQNWYYENGKHVELIHKVMYGLGVLNDTNIDIKDDEKDIKKAFYNELVGKINGRVTPCKKLIDYFIDQSKIKYIDGMKITKDYFVLMSKIERWYEDNEDNFHACLCHGDPNTDNTMIDEDGNVVFIDPRGYFGNLKTIGLGMAEYDIAKFCYGLNGYSRFNSAPYINIIVDSRINIMIDYPTGDGKSITQINLDSMPIDINEKIIVGIIWMKLTSYIINDPMKSIIAYLYGNAICTKYLTQLGYLD